jgi:hypothetical protein
MKPGFTNKQKSKNEESSGPYKNNLDQYVRAYAHGFTVVGRVDYTDETITHFDPHLIGIGTPLSEECRIVEGMPAPLLTGSIQGMQPIPEGKEYMKKFVKDSKQKTKEDLETRAKKLTKINGDKKKS